MSMNICLRLNGHMIDFKWQTSTDETYRIYYENSHHLDASGKPLHHTKWVKSSQKRMWGKLCHIMQNTHFYNTITKRKAKAYFAEKERKPWDKRWWREERKALWEYLVWIRDTPGLEISYT